MHNDRLFRAFIRNVVLLGVIWGPLWFGLIVGELVILFAHYATIWSGFMATGMDPAALADNPLLGWLFTAVGGEDAAMPDLLSLAMAALTGLLAFIVVHFLFQAIGFLWAVWRTVRTNPSVHILSFAWETLVIELILAILLGGCLAVIVMFDFKLYEVRSLIDYHVAAEAAEPATFSAALPQDLWRLVKDVALWGSYPYTAMFLSATLGIYALGRKVDTTFEALCDVCAGLFLGVGSPSAEGTDPAVDNSEAEQLLYGYDADGNPVFDPNTPIAYDAEGNPLTDALNTEPAPADRGSGTPGGAEADAGEPVQNHADEAAELVVPVNSETPRPPVTLQTAMNDPRYYVDPETREVWWRADWERLHRGDGALGEAA